MDSVTAAATRARVLISRGLVALGFKDDAFLLFVAALVGIITAAAAVGFHALIDRIRDLLYGINESFLYGPGSVLLIVYPAVGGLIVGFITFLFSRDARSNGVVDVMESVIRSSGFIRPIKAIEKIFSSAVTIGTGGSCGAEGPIIQIGAALASGFGQFFRLTRTQMPLIIGCGAAAGISAIFNTPMGGLLFALEVILLDFSLKTITPVIVASVVANVTTQAILRTWMHQKEGFAIFSLPRLDNLAVTWPQLFNFLLLGLICGLASVTLTILATRSECWFDRTRMPRSLRPALGGAMLGVLGVVYIGIFGWLSGGGRPVVDQGYPMPAFFGDGYGFIQKLFEHQFYSSASASYLMAVMAFLAVAKVIGTCLTISSGGSGGIIAPSLFIGAVIGGCVGLALQKIGIFANVNPEFYALVGMGAVLAAVVHAPMSAIVILVEISRDYQLALPAVLATIVAMAIAQRVHPDSIYTLGLRQRGLITGAKSEHVLLRRIYVEEVTLDPASLLQPTDPLQTVLDRTSKAGLSDFVVIDRQGYYLGMLLDEDIRSAMVDREAIPLLVTSELIRRDIPFVLNSDDLAHVLDLFTRHNLDHLPVCLATAQGKVIGMVSRGGLMRTFQQRLHGD